MWVCAHLCQAAGVLAPLELELQVVMGILLAIELYKIRKCSALPLLPQDWPRILYVSKANLELLILLFPPL